MKKYVQKFIVHAMICFIAITVYGSQVAEAFIATRLLLPAARKSSVVRKMGGLVHASKPMMKSTKSWFKRQGSAGHIPKEIKKKFNLKKYKSFDGFRRAFWKEMAKHKHLAKKFKEFHPKNIGLMKKGLAPLVPAGQNLGKLKKYMLHHRKRIADGGSVYDLSNLLIVSPRFHKALHTGK
jgi:hypothetical protein